MKYIYNKLVRDRIPENINSMEGRKCNFKILKDDEYLKELDKKLFEEAHEFIEEHSIEDIENARKIKNNKKGSFNDKIYLIDVEQEEIDEREENELKKEWRKNT